MSESHTIVIGGGIVGVSTAYFLARRGHEVTLVEKGDLAAGASFGNAGIIAIGHPPLPRPGLVRQVVKWMLDGGSPLYLPPRFDLALFRWFWTFRKACTESHFRYCMATLTELGRAAKACFDEILETESLDCAYHRAGWREVFRTEAGFAAGRREADLLREYDFEVELLDGDELIARDPAFKAGVAGAVHYAESSFTDPYVFLVQLAERAEAHGATIRTRCEVVRLLADGGRVTGARLDGGEVLEGDTVVIAGGIWSTRLARQIGADVPMQAGKGYHRNVTKPSPCVNVASVLAEKHVAVTPMETALRLSGTVEFSGINDRLVRKRLDMLTAAARIYVHGIDEAQTISEWCGLRPCTADGLPVIGWAPGTRGVFVNTGHARMGFTLGPVSGKLASECILDGRPSLDMATMAADRFGSRRAEPARPAATAVTAP